MNVVLTLLIHLGYLSYNWREEECYIPNKEVSGEIVNAVKACVLNIAYYYARNDYIIHRELASGKGFADLVFIPRKHVDKPAMVVELKYNKDADSAISQIKRKQYPKKLLEYTSNLLLVAITYDKEAKTHECIIESLNH